VHEKQSLLNWLPSFQKKEEIDREKLLESGSRKVEKEGQQEDVEKETQWLIDEADRIKKESKASTTRTLQTLDQTKQVGSDSLQKLCAQGDAMKQMNKDLDTMNSKLDTGRRHLREINSIFGGMVNCFVRKKKVKSSKINELHDHRKEITETDQNIKERIESAANEFPKSGQPKDEVDDDLDEIKRRLDEMQSMATALQEEVIDQSTTIAEVTKQMNGNSSSLSKNLQKMRKI